MSRQNRTAEHASPHRRVRSFVRRSGRISRKQRRALKELRGRYILPDGKRPFDALSAFGRQAPLVCEIGFGSGEALVQLAATAPERDFLGIEVYNAGIGSLLGSLDEAGLTNVRVLQGDALDILASAIPEQAFAAIHIFFPDPWPKKRHHKRRLIQPANVELLCRKLAPGGYLHLATDWPHYAEQMLAVLENAPLLRNAHAGFAPRPDWRPVTKFEARALREGRTAFDLHFLRIEPPADPA